MLATFLQCRQKARFSLDNWEPAPPYMGEALMYGDMFHHLQEMYYSGKVVNAVLALSEYHEKKFEPHWNVIFFEQAVTKVLPVWEGYKTYWTGADAKLSWKECEKVFDVMWNGFRLRGKIDAVLEIKEGGEAWLGETKTKGQISEEDLSDTLNFDLQNTFYLTAMQIMGTPAKGVIYNVIRNPQHKPKNGEGAAAFSARLADEIAKDPGHFYKRYEVRMPDETLIRCQKELLIKLEEFHAMVRGDLPVYRNETACTARGVCAFLKACSQSNMIGYSQTRTPFRELLPC